MRVIIIDDEENAVNSIKTVLEEYCPNVEVVGTATSVRNALLEINNKSPDLVFLDIEMPFMSGIELLESIGSERSFEVIFITAFNEYAIKAFKLSAIDYLLKPLNIPDLINSVKRFEVRRTAYPLVDKVAKLRAALNNKFAVPAADGTEFINIDDVIRVEASGSYTIIYVINNKPRLVSRNLKEIEVLLIDHGFFRTHKSHLINMKYIKKYSPIKDGGTIEMVDGSTIELARSHKPELADLLKYLTKS